MTYDPIEPIIRYRIPAEPKSETLVIETTEPSDVVIQPEVTETVQLTPQFVIESEEPEKKPAIITPITGDRGRGEIYYRIPVEQKPVVVLEKETFAVESESKPQTSDITEDRVQISTAEIEKPIVSEPVEMVSEIPEALRLDDVPEPQVVEAEISEVEYVKPSVPESEFMTYDPIEPIIRYRIPAEPKSETLVIETAEPSDVVIKPEVTETVQLTPQFVIESEEPAKKPAFITPITDDRGRGEIYYRICLLYTSPSPRD